jgi:hypothetical protein
MSTPLLSLIVPWWGGNPAPLKRTIDSVRGICDKIIVVHQPLFDDDREVAESLADKVVTTDWNEVAKETGFAALPNIGAASANGPWLLLLGTGETWAESHGNTQEILSKANPKTMFRTWHEGDVHFWKRVWHKDSGVHFSGPIHEELIGGDEGPLLFRMQDTAKEKHEVSFRNECLRWFKNIVYHSGYYTLLHRPELRGGCNEGWLNFVAGARESIEDFVDTNKDLMEAAWEGDRDAFYEGVNLRMNDGIRPEQVNHNPTGQPMSEGALPAPA